MTERTDAERNPYRMVSWANIGCAAIILSGGIVLIEGVLTIGLAHSSILTIDVGMTLWGTGTLGSWLVDRWSKRILAREIAKIRAKNSMDKQDADD